MRQSHPATLGHPGNGARRYSGRMFTDADPTGLSSPLGQLVSLGFMLLALTVALRWWWSQRKR